MRTVCHITARQYLTRFQSNAQRDNMAKKSSAASGDGKANGSTANIGFAAKLWLAADKLRNVLANPPFNDSDWLR